MKSGQTGPSGRPDTPDILARFSVVCMRHLSAIVGGPVLSLVGGAKASLLVMIMMVGTLYDRPHGSLTASLDQTTGRCSEKTMVNQGCFRCLGGASRVLCSIWCTLIVWDVLMSDIP